MNSSYAIGSPEADLDARLRAAAAVLAPAPPIAAELTELVYKHEERLDAHEATLTAHESRLDAHETTLSVHETRLDGHDTMLATHETRLDGHDTEIATHEIRLDAHDLTLATHETRLDGHDTTLATHTSQIADIEARLDRLETNVHIVTTEAELTAALALGGLIIVPGVTILLNAKIAPAVAGTTIRGFGPGNSALMFSGAETDDRVVHPIAADCTFEDIAIHGGPNRRTGVYLDGFSRNADRLTLRNVWISGVYDGIRMTGGPGSTDADYFADFTLVGSRIFDFDHGGIYAAWELLRWRLQDLSVWGNGASSSWNAIWLGLGMLDCHLSDIVCGNVARHGLEIFYPFAGITLAGQPGPARLSTQFPKGAAVTVHGVTAAQCAGFGCSFAGCKRSSISDITTRNTGSIGVEFADEDPAPSNLSAARITVSGAAGNGLTIDHINGMELTDGRVNDVADLSGVRRGIFLQLSDDITLRGCKLEACGPRYLLSNQCTRVNVVGNVFTALAGEDFSSEPEAEGGNFAVYFYLSDAFFNGNIINGNGTNPLRCAQNGSTITTDAAGSVIPGAYDANFTDDDNLRR